MATVRPGDQAVLLVVDTQAAVIDDAWEAPRIVANIARAIETARTHGVPVIWIQHSDDDLPKGSDGWELTQGLSRAEGEIRIDKHYESSFEQTSLEETLAELDATRIVLAGAASNWCIRSTAFGALDRGYDLTLIEDAHTTGSMQFPDGVTIEAAHIVRELNNAMTWLTYPGRTNVTVSTAELAFGDAAH